MGSLLFSITSLNRIPSCIHLKLFGISGLLLAFGAVFVHVLLSSSILCEMAFLKAEMKGFLYETHTHLGGCFVL